MPDEKVRWVKKTGRFGFAELYGIQDEPPESLAVSLVDYADPIVALRAIAEVMLNGDEAKLEVLLKSDELTKHWRKFEKDLEVDDRDRDYAKQLELRLLPKTE